MVQRRIRHRRSRQCIWLAIAIIAMTYDVAIGSPLLLGMNYSWFRFDLRTLELCQTRPSEPFVGAGILPLYEKEGVRPIVVAQLRQMRRSGFKTLRIRVAGSRQAPQLGRLPIPISDRGILEPYSTNLRNFIEDVGQAGFRNMEVSFGFTGSNNLYCKKSRWGDCFDESRTEENWRFMNDAIQIISPIAENISVRYDLINEGCPSHALLESVQANAVRYLQYMARRYVEHYGADSWLISCPDTPNAERVHYLMNIMSQAALRPKYIEVHTYRTEASYLLNLLASTEKAAASIDADVILGEIRYHSLEQAQAVQTFVRETPENHLREIYQWPLAKPGVGCPVDVGPPFTPGPLLELRTP